MIISSLVAVSKNGVIGKDNDIPWYLPADLAYFKKTTIQHTIIMGRKTYESIGRPLPKRTNIIVTRNPYFASSHCLVAHSVAEALEMAHERGEDEVFIIGGGKIFDISYELWDRLYLTEVDVEVDGDVFFTEINLDDWNLISEDRHQKDEKNEFDYTFKVYERI